MRIVTAENGQRKEMEQVTGEKVEFKCPKCGRSHVSHLARRLHLRDACPVVVAEEKANGVKYVCEFCNKELGNRRGLLQHKYRHCQKRREQKAAGKEVKYKCPKCGSSYVSQIARRIHLKNSCSVVLAEEKAKGVNHVCEFCNKELGSRRCLEAHKDNYCQKRREQRKAAGEKVEFKCPECGSSYNNKPALRRHLKNSCPVMLAEEKTNGVNHVCEFCNKELGSSRTLQQHKDVYCEILKEQRKAAGEKVELKCPKCDRYYNNKPALRKHLKYSCPVMLAEEKAKGVKYVCEFCGKECRSHRGLEAHKDNFCQKRREQRKAAEEKVEFNWPKCDSNYNSKPAGREHLQNPCPVVVVEEKAKGVKYVCEFCNKELGSHKGLLQHKYNHCQKRREQRKAAGKEVEFNCPKCGSSYNNRPGLRRHLKNSCPVVLAGEKAKGVKYVCEFCNKELGSHRGLQEHKYNHCQKVWEQKKAAGEKVEFKCPKCSKSYETKRNVYRHLQNSCPIVKTEEMNKGIEHRCKYCKLVLKSPETLKQHEDLSCSIWKEMRKKAGNNAKVFTCSACGKVYPYNASLRRHIRFRCKGKVEKDLGVPLKESDDVGNLEPDLSDVVDVPLIHKLKDVNPENNDSEVSLEGSDVGNKNEPSRDFDVVAPQDEKVIYPTNANYTNMGNVYLKRNKLASKKSRLGKEMKIGSRYQFQSLKCPSNRQQHENSKEEYVRNDLKEHENTLENSEDVGDPKRDKDSDLDVLKPFSSTNMGITEVSRNDDQDIHFQRPLFESNDAGDHAPVETASVDENLNVPENVNSIRGVSPVNCQNTKVAVQCSNCDSSFVTKNFLNTHLIKGCRVVIKVEKKFNLMYPCHFCKMELKSPFIRQQHEKIECSIGKEVIKKSEWEATVTPCKGRPNNETASIFSKTSNESPLMCESVKDNDNVNVPFKCRFCNMQFKTRRNFIHHESALCPVKNEMDNVARKLSKVKCNNCQKVLANKTSLRVHLQGSCPPLINELKRKGVTFNCKFVIRNLVVQTLHSLIKITHVL